jgi:hypothetical protein
MTYGFAMMEEAAAFVFGPSLGRPTPSRDRTIAKLNLFDVSQFR